MILTPRELRLFPLDAMLRLSVAAGWNQTTDDWQRLIQLNPGLCFGIAIGNTLAATATAHIRRDRSAWIGMVLTLPEFRGRRLARTLVHHLLNILDARQTQTVGLDATDMGKPLYESLGFVDLCPIERWSRPGQPIAAGALENRQAQLQIRQGRLSNYLGPFRAHNEAAAQSLLAQIPTEASLYWDLFPHNTLATRLAANIGLQPDRRLMRMYRGQPLPIPPETTLAIEGFEFG